MSVLSGISEKSIKNQEFISGMIAAPFSEYFIGASEYFIKINFLFIKAAGLIIAAVPIFTDLSAYINFFFNFFMTGNPKMLLMPFHNRPAVNDGIKIMQMMIRYNPSSSEGMI